MGYSTFVRRLCAGIIAVTTGALLTACGPINAASAIADGESQLARAKAIDAATHAKYHYTKARLLLVEAKQRNGYGEYQVAREWANEARELASEAFRTARARQELKRRRIRVKPKAIPKPSEPKSTTPTQLVPKRPDPKTGKVPPKTTPAPAKKRPLKPPPRRKILPPSFGGGK